MNEVRKYREEEVISELKQRTQELGSKPHHLEIIRRHVQFLTGEINSGSL